MADEVSSPGSAVENRSPVRATDGTGLSDDDEQPSRNHVEDDEDDEDDDMPSKRRGKIGNAAVDDNMDDEDEGDQDDLFGDNEEDEEPAPKRHLDDEELDSGDDQGRDDRIRDTEDGPTDFETMEQQIVTMDVEMPRHYLPEPSDGEMYLLKVPTFMSIDPKAWDFTKFQPPTTDHHSKLKPSDSFSAYKTALTTIRWRRSPNNPAELQSNARINRWSDGSLTLQLASDPTVQYEIDGNSLAPPQRNPLKPTPVSVKGGSKGGRQGMLLHEEKYDQTKDSFTYLSAPLVDAEALRIVHKVTAGLTVKQSGVAEDDALEKLQKSLAEAAHATKVNGGSGIDLAQLTEDPELGRKRAEIAERDKEKARKRREAAEERNANRSGRVLGRISSNRYGDGGLTIGGLEDDELGTTTGRNRTAGKGPRRARQRRNSEYSDEEENGRKAFRATQEDYEVDDFVADDDDEEEIDDDDEEEEELLDDVRDRHRSPKRPAAGEEDDDAEGEPDDEVSAPKAKRQRKIVDEDDDDDE